MPPVRIERVALQVQDLGAAVTQFSRLWQTSFHRREVSLPDGSRVRVALSPLGVELLEDPGQAGREGLRSFHLRVTDLAEARARTQAAGGEILGAFRVGTMAHLVTRTGPFRILYVQYPGDDALAAFFGRTGAEAARQPTPGEEDVT